RRYGPLPFTLTLTAMCRDFNNSNGTLMGFSSAWSGTANRAYAATVRIIRFMLQPLSEDDGGFDVGAAADHRQGQFVASLNFGHNARPVREEVDFCLADLLDFVAGLQPALVGRPAGQQRLHHHAVVLRQFRPEEAARLPHRRAFEAQE